MSGESVAQRCAETVFDNYHSRGCVRRGIIERDGKFYCKQHDPVAVAERKSAASAKYEANFQSRSRIYHLHAAAPDLLAACKLLLTEAELSTPGTRAAHLAIQKAEAND